MSKHFKDESIFRDTREFTSPDGSWHRFIRDGSTWGYYRHSGDSFVYECTIVAHRSASCKTLHAKACGDA